MSTKQSLKIIRTGVTEKDIEKYLIRECIKIGGKAYKFNSPSNASVHDRLCVFPLGLIAFIECKRPGEEPTPAQWDEINYFKDMGQISTYVDSKKAVDRVLTKIRKLIIAARKSKENKE